MFSRLLGYRSAQLRVCTGGSQLPQTHHYSSGNASGSSSSTNGIKSAVMTPALALRILGLQAPAHRARKGASQEDAEGRTGPITLAMIKAAYKRRVLEIHPDVVAGSRNAPAAEASSMEHKGGDTTFTFHQLQEALAMATRAVSRGDAKNAGDGRRWDRGVRGHVNDRGETLEDQVSEVVRAYASLANAFTRTRSPSDVGSINNSLHAVTDACSNERSAMQTLQRCASSLPSILSRGGSSEGGVAQYVLFDTFPLYHPLYTAAMSKAVDRFSRDLPYIARRVVKGRGSTSGSTHSSLSNFVNGAPSGFAALVPSPSGGHGGEGEVFSPSRTDKEREHTLELSRRMRFVRAFKFSVARTGAAGAGGIGGGMSLDTVGNPLHSSNAYASDVVAQEMNRLGYDHDSAVSHHNANRHRPNKDGEASPDFKFNVFSALRGREALASEMVASAGGTGIPGKDPNSPTWWWSNRAFSPTAQRTFKSYSDRDGPTNGPASPSAAVALLDASRDLLRRRNDGNLCDMVTASKAAIESKPLKPLVFVGALVFGHIGNAADHASLGSSDGEPDEGKASVTKYPPRSMGPQSVSDIRCAPELKCLVRCARFAHNDGVASDAAVSGDSVDAVSAKLAQWEQASTKRLAVELAMHDQCAALSALLLSPSVSLAAEVHSSSEAGSLSVAQHSPHLSALYSTGHSPPSVTSSFKVAALTVRQQLHFDTVDAVAANLTLRRLEFLLGGIVDSYSLQSLSADGDEATEGEGGEDMAVVDAESVLRKIVAEITVLQACGAVADAIGGPHPEILLMWEPTPALSDHPTPLSPGPAALDDKLLRDTLDAVKKSEALYQRTQGGHSHTDASGRDDAGGWAEGLEWGPEWCSALIGDPREVFQVASAPSFEKGDESSPSPPSNLQPAATSTFRDVLQKVHQLSSATYSEASAATPTVRITPDDVLKAVAEEVAARDAEAYHRVTREELRLEHEYNAAVRRFTEWRDGLENDDASSPPGPMQNPRRFIAAQFLSPASGTCGATGGTLSGSTLHIDEDERVEQDALNAEEAEEVRGSRRAAASYFTVRRIPQPDCGDFEAKPQFEVCVYLHKNPVRFLRSLLLAQREVVRRAAVYGRSYLPALREIHAKLESAEFIPLSKPAAAVDSSIPHRGAAEEEGDPPSHYVDRAALSFADLLLRSGTSVASESVTAAAFSGGEMPHHLSADGSLSSFPVEGSLEEERLIARLTSERIMSEQVSSMSYRHAQRRTGLLRSDGPASLSDEVPHPTPIASDEAARIQAAVREELRMRRGMAVAAHAAAARRDEKADRLTKRPPMEGTHAAAGRCTPQTERDVALDAHVRTAIDNAHNIRDALSASSATREAAAGASAVSPVAPARKHTRDDESGKVISGIAESTRKRRTSGYHRSMLAAEAPYEVRGTHDVGENAASDQEVDAAQDKKAQGAIAAASEFERMFHAPTIDDIIDNADDALAAQDTASTQAERDGLVVGAALSSFSSNKMAPALPPPPSRPPPPAPPTISGVAVGSTKTQTKYKKKPRACVNPPSPSADISEEVPHSPATTASVSQHLSDTVHPDDLVSKPIDGTAAPHAVPVPHGYVYRAPIRLIASTHGFEDPRLLLGFYRLLHHHRVDVAKVEHSMSVEALSALRHKQTSPSSAASPAPLTRSRGWQIYGDCMPPGCIVKPQDRDDDDDGDDGGGLGKGSMLNGWYGDSVSLLQVSPQSGVGVGRGPEGMVSPIAVAPTTPYFATPSSPILSNTHEDMIVVTKKTIFLRVPQTAISPTDTDNDPLSGYTLNHEGFLRWLRAVSAASHLFVAARRIVVEEGLWYVVRDPTGVMDEADGGDDTAGKDTARYAVRSCGPLSPRKFLSFLSVYRYATAARAALEQQAYKRHHRCHPNPTAASATRPLLTPETVGFVLVVCESVTSLTDGRLYVPWNADPSVLVSLLSSSLIREELEANDDDGVHLLTSANN